VQPEAGSVLGNKHLLDNDVTGSHSKIPHCDWFVSEEQDRMVPIGQYNRMATISSDMSSLKEVAK
jgi:hypothetical protein